MRFTIVPDSVDDAGLNPLEFRVMHILLKHANEDGECFPSRERIAEIAKISVSSVGRQIRSLLDRGLIAVRNRPDGPNPRSNLYTILAPYKPNRSERPVYNPNESEEPAKQVRETCLNGYEVPVCNPNRSEGPAKQVRETHSNRSERPKNYIKYNYTQELELREDLKDKEGGVGGDSAEEKHNVQKRNGSEVEQKLDVGEILATASRYFGKEAAEHSWVNLKALPGYDEKSDTPTLLKIAASRVAGLSSEDWIADACEGLKSRLRKPDMARLDKPVNYLCEILKGSAPSKLGGRTFSQVMADAARRMPSKLIPKAKPP